jgi:hypothetical protein
MLTSKNDKWAGMVLTSLNLEMSNKNTRLNGVSCLGSKSR